MERPTSIDPSKLLDDTLPLEVIWNNAIRSHFVRSYYVFLFLQGDYGPEKYPVIKHASPPVYSFGSRTPYGKKDNYPGPDSYSLPAVLGSKCVGKRSAAAFSMTGRSKIGSFHEDLQKVCL